MRALVVYESMFGNTKMIAEAIASGIARHFEVATIDVGSAPTIVAGDVGLLVVGGPTHAFGLSRSSTRQSASDQAGTTVTPVTTGLRNWLEALDHPQRTVVAAAFDTRVKRRGVPGSAARAAERRIRRLGYVIAADAESFWVTGTPGPLVDGERARAEQWGSDIASRMIQGERSRAKGPQSMVRRRPLRDYEQAALIAAGGGIGLVTGLVVGGAAVVAFATVIGAATGVFFGAARQSFAHKPGA